MGSCPKLLHCVILSWFSSCFGWNLQFRTILKVVNKVHILWNQYWNFAFFMFWDGTLKNFIKMCIFLSIFGFVLIWRFRNLQFRTRLMVALVSFWTPSRWSMNLKLQEKIKDTVILGKIDHVFNLKVKLKIWNKFLAVLTNSMILIKIYTSHDSIGSSWAILSGLFLPSSAPTPAKLGWDSLNISKNLNHPPQKSKKLKKLKYLK